MSRAIQLHLPGFDLEPELNTGGRRTRRSRWYYVASVRRGVMVILDERGHYCEAPHDTVRVTPHLFNQRSLALVVARGKRDYSVHVYRWEVRNERIRPGS